MQLEGSELKCELLDLESMQIARFDKPIPFSEKKRNDICRSYRWILRKLSRYDPPPIRDYKNQLRKIGVLMWDDLLEKVFIDFDLKSRKGSYISLALDDSTILFPWELALYSKRPRTMLCETFSVGRLRAIESEYWVQFKPRRTKRKTALVVGLNYEDYRSDLGSDDKRVLEHAEEEAKFVRDLLEYNGFDITLLPGKKATKERILNNLQRRLDVFHFTGHGSTYQDRSLISASDGDLDTKEVIDGISDAPKVSFINACESVAENAEKGGERAANNWAKALATYGGSTLVATLWSIFDKPSARFSQWFYNQFIKKEKPLGDAIRLSRKHIKNGDESVYTWPAYVVYGYPHLSFKEILQINA